VLRELHIRDYALIDRLTCQFTPGLNILTGETGAGKSIIIDAVYAVLGGRCSVESIKGDREQALVEACFEVDNPPVEELLDQLGYSLEDGLLILTREINRNGRHRCRINGRPAPLHVVSQIGQALLDIHGQHEHQTLLQRETHCDYLDGFIGSQALQLREKIGRLLQEYNQRVTALKKLQQGAQERERQRDFLAHQLAEIEGANLQLGEDEALERERLLLKNTTTLLQGSQGAYDILFGGGESPITVSHLLAQATSQLETAVRLDPGLETIYGTLESLTIQAQELAVELRAYAEGIEASPERLDEVERRIDLINHLKRKYGATVEEILAVAQEMEAQLAAEEDKEEQEARLQKEIKTLGGELGELAAQLTKLRREGAKELERAVLGELEYLHMAQAQFEVGFFPLEKGSLLPDGGLITPLGAEGIEFLMSANPGHSVKPLARIASGGEMSRIMLALKTVLAASDAIGTLVFDEIDTGIGGRTADAVAIRLGRLSRQRQIILVTHLPQIASMADTHYHIYKEVEDGKTQVHLRSLVEETRIEELARMLGGNRETALEHARELISRAEEEKRLAG
jgi:DNA repair protein RecN (Recombination protein N)